MIGYQFPAALTFSAPGLRAKWAPRQYPMQVWPPLRSPPLTQGHGLEPEVGQVHLPLSRAPCHSPRPANADSLAHLAAPLPQTPKSSASAPGPGDRRPRSWKVPARPARAAPRPCHTHQALKELLTEGPAKASARCGSR